ncbi:hypothetical protein [Kumtagia ephedrae]|nr:hypothetical protein [Mesorhizobium ephedrae]
MGPDTSDIEALTVTTDDVENYARHWLAIVLNAVQKIGRLSLRAAIPKR